MPARKPSAKAVWNQPAPNTGGARKLTSKSKALAKAAAQKAGRPYPNLIDNMMAAQKQSQEKPA
ncbi:MAG: hypothetical protein JWL81_3501 [Verrucomicrobiales bacterium]|nr:hypothetical protein [Verrucomicrobiales bacterium]